MSLLLDALKKAAEQKAEKSRQETPAASPSDETDITAAAEDLSELGQGTGHGLPQSRRVAEDETELGDLDSTLSQKPSLSAQMQTGEDETIVFAEEDVSDFLGEPELVNRETKSHDDDTDLDQTEYQTHHATGDAGHAGDETEVDQTEYQTHHEAGRSGDETEVDQTEYQTHHEAGRSGDETEVDQTEYQTHHEAGRSGDETEVDQTEYQTHHEAGRSGDETEVDQTEYQTHHEAGRSGDETEVDQTEYQTHHEAGRSGDETAVDQTEYQTHHEAGRSGDETEVDQTEYQTHHEAGRSGDETEVDQTEYQTHHATGDAGHPGDETEIQPGAIQDEDLSLLLVEHDDTNLTNRTSLTDPQVASYAQVSGSDDTAMDELALVDITQHQKPAEKTETAAATQTNATTGIASTAQTTQGATTRIDSTSTHTYAPDNYDRTLVKLPSDDASKIFAGMKSDSDVVMTPDYAKKVFRSKSSAKRLQDYKVYAGIAVAILLSIGIFSTFELQHESDSIDSSLRPLKRDPMPGIIKPEENQQETNLFAESGANSRTIEIIESAGNASETAVMNESVIADEGVITGESVIADEAMSTDNVVISESTAEVESSTVVSVTVAPAQTESVETTQIASIAQAETSTNQAESSTSTLEIISTSKVAQKDLWLREAYAAYKSGNDSLAMTRYNQVLEVDPGNRNALLARAAINVQNNNGNAAIKDYQTLLVHNPKDSLAMTSLITVANFSPLEAESQLKLMIRDEPDSPYLNFALANTYGVQNRWQEAQGYYFKALENNPGDPNYAYNLAVSLEHIAQPLAAVGYYQRALDNIDNGLATFSREIVSQRMETLAKQ